MTDNDRTDEVIDIDSVEEGIVLVPENGGYVLYYTYFKVDIFGLGRMYAAGKPLVEVDRGLRVFVKKYEDYQGTSEAEHIMFGFYLGSCYPFIDDAKKLTQHFLESALKEKY